jgi:hypothetical protein
MKVRGVYTYAYSMEYVALALVYEAITHTHSLTHSLITHYTHVHTLHTAARGQHGRVLFGQ